MYFLYFDFRNNVSSFTMKYYYRQTRFTNKIQVRAYTLDDLIGSCGGYIGLFLGYALIQFPQLIESTIQIVNRKILDLEAKPNNM